MSCPSLGTGEICLRRPGWIDAQKALERRGIFLGSGYGERVIAVCGAEGRAARAVRATSGRASEERTDARAPEDGETKAAQDLFPELGQGRSSEVRAASNMLGLGKQELAPVQASRGTPTGAAQGSAPRGPPRKTQRATYAPWRLTRSTKRGPVQVTVEREGTAEGGEKRPAQGLAGYQIGGKIKDGPTRGGTCGPWRASSVGRWSGPSRAVKRLPRVPDRTTGLGHRHTCFSCTPHSGLSRADTAGTEKYHIHDVLSFVEEACNCESEQLTVSMTTLIEDGSKMCWASGPAGMGDGVMTPQKKQRKSE